MAAIIAVIVFLLAGCKDFLKNQVDGVDVKNLLNKTQPELDSLMRHAGQNAGTGFSKSARIISQELVLGFRDSLGRLDPEIQKIVDHFGSMSEEKLDALGKKLEQRLNSLKDNIKDEELKAFLIGLIEESTGKLKKQTKTLLSDMIQEALNSFDAETAKQKIQLIVRGALDDSTKVQAQKLVQGALQPTIDSIMNRIDKIVHKDVPFIQRQAENLLLALAALAAAIIGWVWYQRRRYAKLVGILTYQIDKIPSQELYDELTKRIRSDTQKSELEPLLREVLKDQGINT